MKHLSNQTKSMKSNHPMKSIILIFVNTCATLPVVLANGGGYWRGGVESTGTILGFEPAATEKVRIMDEQLNIALGADEATVEVRYVMRNSTDTEAKVRFGFPVEESFDRQGSEVEEPKPLAGWKELRNCHDYQVTVAGKPLEAKFETEPGGNRDPKFHGLAGWLVSAAVFAPGAEVSVKITYRSAYTQKAMSVSDDFHESERLFSYRLSTGACWADTIARGRVVVTAAGANSAEIRVLKPLNRFSKDGANWVWDFENLEPTLADDIQIEVSPAVNSYMRRSPLCPDSDFYVGDRPWSSAAVAYEGRGDRWTMSHRNYQATASSTKAAEGDLDYDAANLNDDSTENAWSEGKPGPGVGEWLELKPEISKPLTAIILSPGHMGSDELFKANARPKKVRVQLNGEHEFTAEIPDRNDIARIPVVGYAKPVNTVRLTFDDVWKGAKTEDLCVSSVALEVLLDKNPQIQPAR